jgi:hypothetical protein
MAVEGAAAAASAETREVVSVLERAAGRRNVSVAAYVDLLKAGKVKPQYSLNRALIEP